MSLKTGDRVIIRGRVATDEERKRDNVCKWKTNIWDKTSYIGVHGNVFSVSTNGKCVCVRLDGGGCWEFHLLDLVPEASSKTKSERIADLELAVLNRESDCKELHTRLKGSLDQIGKLERLVSSLTDKIILLEKRCDNIQGRRSAKDDIVKTHDKLFPNPFIGLGFGLDYGTVTRADSLYDELRRMKF